jgi:hypothetical protein
LESTCQQRRDDQPDGKGRCNIEHHAHWAITRIGHARSKESPIHRNGQEAQQDELSDQFDLLGRGAATGVARHLDRRQVASGCSVVSANRELLKIAGKVGVLVVKRWTLPACAEPYGNVGLQIWSLHRNGRNSGTLGYSRSGHIRSIRIGNHS